MNSWDDEQPKQKRGQTASVNIDPNDVLSQVEQQFSQAGIDLNLSGSKRRRTGCGMGCGLFAILGVLSFIAIFVFAFGVAFFPDFAKAMSPAFCQTGNTLKTVEGMHTIDGTEVFFQCFDGDNRMVEDVSGKIILVIFGLICLPFLFVGLGVLTSMRGLFGMASRYRPTVTVPAGSGVSGVSYRTVDGVDVNVVDLRSKAKRDDLTGAASGNVTERLRELQEAYSAGLITKDEYDRKRQEILSEL